MTDKTRCDWPGADALMLKYHDEEWGVPLHDERKLFEFIVLDGFQAGLSWSCIMKKRENLRRAFAGFDPVAVAKFDAAKVAELLADPGIIRNRAKVNAAIGNASCFLEVQREFGSFDAYIWQFTHGKTLVNRWKSSAEIPVTSIESDAMSADLKKRGFKFVGSTICYAFMQAAGMVNDHLVSCFRHEACRGERG